MIAVDGEAMHGPTPPSLPSPVPRQDVHNEPSNPQPAPTQTDFVGPWGSQWFLRPCEHLLPVPETGTGNQSGSVSHAIHEAS